MQKKMNKLHEISKSTSTPLMIPTSLLFFLLVVLSTSNAAPLPTTLNSTAQRLDSANVIIRPNSTIVSENRTFKLGFFTQDGGTKWYLGIWYASIPTSPFVWVANRDKPITNLSSTTLEITSTGHLAILESASSVLWQTTNTEKAADLRLLETGNVVLVSASGDPVWQSFDFPTDTWLPGMNLTADKYLTSWRNSHDPSPGLYSLRLDPHQYNEFELVYNKSGFVDNYWASGNWTGTAFAEVPEMTVTYIYRFHFADPFTPAASFWFTEAPLDSALKLPLTRFRVEVNGQLKQYTWSQQTGNWDMFWSRPDNPCKVHGLCGNLGVCKETSSDIKPCSCLSGFKPISDSDWESGDFSAGCGRENDGLCDKSDGFQEVGVVEFVGAFSLSIGVSSRRSCESSCLGNCSCIGMYYDDKTKFCKNLYGPLLNLRNLSSDRTFQDVLFIRVPKGVATKVGSKYLVLVSSIAVSVAILVLAVAVFLILGRRRMRGKGVEEDGVFPTLILKVFSYNELYAATCGFSDKLGHGGFGAVFQGKLLDSTPVAVKRLERPGSGEKEFRAEVCTIGNIQHVNLVRLRGFCSENSHRLLVYDYMPNGPLSAYLRRDGQNLSWDVRFRIAVGTARGIAYLHEECRDCIIHCDIKPENILLDGDYTAKVSDFGLAKLVGRDFSRVLATMRGTWGYVAPEWISGVAITTKADVYSYGMTLLELLGGRRNVEAPPSAGANVCKEGEKGEKWFFPPYAAQHILAGNVAAVVDDRLGSAYNDQEAERVALVAIWCIQDGEEMRPTMRTVVKMLEGVVEITNPPPPKLLQALISGESYHGIQVDSGGDNAEVYSCSLHSSPGNFSLPPS